MPDVPREGCEANWNKRISMFKSIVSDYLFSAEK